MANDITFFQPNSLSDVSPNGLMIPVDLYESVDFRTFFNQKQIYADSVLTKVTEVVSAGALGNHIKDGMKKESRWVVKMSDELKSAIDSGAVKLDYSKTGEVFAQLRDASGHFGEKLPITEEIIRAGIDPMAVSQALQMKAIQDQLNNMMDVLEEIGSDVQEWQFK